MTDFFFFEPQPSKKTLPWEIVVKGRLNDTVKLCYDVVLAKQMQINMGS